MEIYNGRPKDINARKEKETMEACCSCFCDYLCPFNAEIFRDVV